MAEPTGAEAESFDELERQAQALQAQLDAAPVEQAATWWSVTNAMTISMAVLIFGLITVLIAAYLMRHERNGQLVLRALTTILIITFAVFLIVAGYSDQQIAPAFGLLGTLAGYLLGKDAKSSSVSSSSDG